MVTRLYLHGGNSTVAGTLPTTEQSTLTSAVNASAQSTNLLMNTSIATGGFAFITYSSTVSTRDIYIGKWVSARLNQTSIAANTWTYYFCANESDLAANHPVSGIDQPVYVNCYVWRPSNGTKVGTILDGNTAATVDESVTAPTYVNHVVTFTGSAVSSIVAGDVIVFEVWFRITSGSSGGTQYFMYDGPNVFAENQVGFNAATYIETPEDLSFLDDSHLRLYFYAANSTIPGLPNTEQSALTADQRGDDQTVNRAMYTLPDSSGFTTVSAFTPSPTGSPIPVTYNMCRFASPLFTQTSIPAGRWIYGFATLEAVDDNNFPVTGTNNPVRVNLYVWQPSTQTKIGTILDGNTANTVSEGGIGSNPASNAIWHVTTFDGSAVSGITPADAVLIFEVWFQVTTGPAPSSTNSFYFSGTQSSANNDIILGGNVASYIETSQALTFIEGAFIQKAVPAQTAAVTDSASRIVTRQTRQRLLTDITAITDSLDFRRATRPYHKVQVLPNQNITITDTVGFTITRSIALNKQRVPYTEVVQVSDTLESKVTSGTIIYTGDPEYRMV